MMLLFDLLRSLQVGGYSGSLLAGLVVLCATWLLMLFWKKGKFPPGPMGVPIFGALPFLGNEPHKVLWDMKKKYGDVIGVYFGRQYTVIMNNYEIAKEVISDPAVLDRPENLFSKKPYIGFNVDNGAKWVEQRRFCMSVTRDLGLGRGHWEDIIVEAATDFSQSLHQHKGQSVDISNSLISSLASNIVGMIIGRKLDKDHEKDKIQLFMDFNEYSFTFVGPSKITTLVPSMRTIFEILKIGKYDAALKTVQNFSTFVRQEISRHKSSPEMRSVHDFINSYLDEMEKQNKLQNKKHFFSEDTLEGNMNILFLASSDTVFSSLQWLVRLMAKYPVIQERVYKEIVKEVPGKVARYEDRHSLPYTFSTFMESQRVSSIVPLSTTRKLNRDVKVGEYIIPKGSCVSANIWGIHHDPTYFDNPHEFQPERFLTNNGTMFIKNPPGYAAFSLGRRNCPGETIAWMAIMSYFTEIMKKFEISIPPGEKLQFNVINGLVSRLQPQNLCFKPRNSI